MTFGRAPGKFGATITFAGTVPSVNQTMPLAVYMAWPGITIPESPYPSCW